MLQASKRDDDDDVVSLAAIPRGMRSCDFLVTPWPSE